MPSITLNEPTTRRFKHVSHPTRAVIDLSAAANLRVSKFVSHDWLVEREQHPYTFLPNIVELEDILTINKEIFAG